MDGQNFENGNNYQDNTSNTYSQTPSSGNPQAPKQTNALAIVSLVLGIASIVLGCCTGYVGLICGIAGLICAIVSKKQGKSGVGTAGLVCSIIGLVLSVLILVFASIFGLAAIDYLNSMGYYY